MRVVQSVAVAVLVAALASTAGAQTCNTSTLMQVTSNFPFNPIDTNRPHATLLADGSKMYMAMRAHSGTVATNWFSSWTIADDAITTFPNVPLADSNNLAWGVPYIVALSTGGFAFAWCEEGTTNGVDCYGQIFDNDGVSQTSAFLLHPGSVSGNQRIQGEGGLVAVGGGRFGAIIGNGGSNTIYLFSNTGAFLSSQAVGPNCYRAVMASRNNRVAALFCIGNGAGVQTYDVDPTTHAWTLVSTSPTVDDQAVGANNVVEPWIALHANEQYAYVVWEEDFSGDRQIVGQAVDVVTGTLIGANLNPINEEAVDRQMTADVTFVGNNIVVAFMRQHNTLLYSRTLTTDGSSAAQYTATGDQFIGTGYAPASVLLNPQGDFIFATTGGSPAGYLGYRTGYCFVAPASPLSCDCSAGLGVDYTSDRVPDASKQATTSISLNETTWEVVFTVSNVLHLKEGHVIAGKPNTRQTAEAAFTPLVSAWDAAALWKPENCTVGPLDTPASGQGITVTKDSNCVKTYQMVFSLVDASKQNGHCTLVANADDLAIGCHVILTSTRAYDLTEPTAFLSSETSFTANITLPRNLNNQVSDLLYATLAKCNVLNSPDFAIDCRAPGIWNFRNTFAVAQNIPDWIDASSCAHSTTAAATFVRCALTNGVPVAGYTEAAANITATIDGGARDGEQLTFSLEYTLPRLSSATASASLQNFIVGVSMLNEKYYYAGADRATILVEVFDTSRLQITQLDMFNANGQVYSLSQYPQFQLAQSNNATHFSIEFRPSAIRQDSAFYRNGPHGVNISFLFTAASNRRQMIVAQANNADGYVTVTNINVQGPTSVGTGNAAAGAASSANSAASSSVLIAVLAGVAVLSVGTLVAVVVVVRRRRSLTAPQAAADDKASSTGSRADQPSVVIEIADDQV